MTQALSQFIDLECTPPNEEGEGIATTKLGIKISMPVIHDLWYHPRLQYLARSINVSWVYLPKPPSSMSPIDIVLLLLSSKGYQMSPSTFSWQGSDHNTYHSIWKLILRCASIEPECKFISPYILSRSAGGYNSWHGLSMLQRFDYATLEGTDPVLYKELQSLALRPQVPPTTQYSYTTTLQPSLLYCIGDLMKM